MTDYGIKVINSTGQTQIDSNYRNLKLLGQSSAGAAKAQLGAWIDTAIGLGLGNNELPFIGMRANASYYNSLDGVGADGDLKFDLFHVYPEANLTVYYTSWGRGTFSAENYGIEVYNAAGAMVFDATMDWMKIVGVYAGSVTKDNISDKTVVDAINNYFYLTNSCSGIDTAAGKGYFRRGFKSTSPTNIRIGTYYFHDAIPEDASVSYWEDTYQLIEIKAP